MKPLPTSPRIPADPAGKTRLHGSSSPLFPANPLDNEHGSCGIGLQGHPGCCGVNRFRRGARPPRVPPPGNALRHPFRLLPVSGETSTRRLPVGALLQQGSQVNVFGR